MGREFFVAKTPECGLKKGKKCFGSLQEKGEKTNYVNLKTAAEKKEYYQNSCDILCRCYNMLYLYCTCE